MLTIERIFISHSSRDKEIIQAFIDDILIGSLMININDIFCTTTNGTKIHSGEDWRMAIREHLINAKVTFLIITPNYKVSEVCLNEMGAAWVLSGRTIPLLIEPVNYKSVGILQEVVQQENLQDEKSLDRIKDILQDCLGIQVADIKSDRWTAKKKEFLEKLDNHLRINPFDIPVTKDMVENLSVQVEVLDNKNKMFEVQIDRLSSENKRLTELNSDYRKSLKPEEVSAIENKYNHNSMFEELINLCDNVKEALSKVNGIISTIIYRSYTRKTIYFSYDGWEQNIREAIARDFLIDYESLEPDWNTTKIMKNIKSSLDELKIFIDKNGNVEELVTEYECAFNAPLNISNLDFWKQLFDAKIYLD